MYFIKMNVCMYVLYAFLNGWIDFDEIFCVCLSSSLDDLDSQLDPIGLTRKGLKQGFWDLRWSFLFVNGQLLLLVI